MQVKKQLQNTLGLERDTSLDGANVEHALINDGRTVSFVDASVDEFIGINRRDAVSAEVSGFYQRANRDGNGVRNYLVRFEGKNDRQTHLNAGKVADIAVAVDVHPDKLLSEINWQILGSDSPVVFIVPAEGWVAIAPTLVDMDESSVDSFADLACVDAR